MILLDTNVMSEPLRHTPEPRVIEWIDAQVMETLFLSAITVAELRAGDLCLILIDQIEEALDHITRRLAEG